MPRPYKDKIPPKSEQFGFGGEVKSEILNHSVPEAALPAGRQTRGLGDRGGSDSWWGKGGDTLIRNLEVPFRCLLRGRATWLAGHGATRSSYLT